MSFTCVNLVFLNSSTNGSLPKPHSTAEMLLAKKDLNGTFYCHLLEMAKYCLRSFVSHVMVAQC